jgi:DNA replication licensing factor MCM4
MPSVPGSDVDQSVIWGTSVQVSKLTHQATLFVHEFKLPGEQDKYLYRELLEECLKNSTLCVNLDAEHLFEFDRELYEKMIQYPQEVVPLLDNAFNKCADEWFEHLISDLRQNSGNQEPHVVVRPFNLRDKQPLRLLDPKHIDTLVATSGMVIRVSQILPDMQSAWFKCTVCGHELDSGIENGRINEPTLCENKECRTRNSYQLIYHRCYFTDRQLIKVQESPESIPEGETPHTIDVFCHDSLVDFCKPGDRIEATGVYRCKSVRSNPRQSKIEAVYSTHLDAVHVSKKKKAVFSVQKDERDRYASFTQVDQTTRQIEEKKRKLTELGEDPNIYERLAKSFAPSIWEMTDVKKGILCQLFGATAKNFGDNSTNTKDSKFRNEMNILLCGDPGVAKSQFLQYVHKVAPRGIYTSGKGSSAVGLTAYITKDPDTHDLVLESGALVLSDRGICCIDEFDKMGEGARSILHEVMEQQTVSIAKAGIIAQLNARTSILAAANPIESRYNPKRAVTENIDLPPTLLSRFDLIYLLLDTPNKHLDRTLAQHLVSLYFREGDREKKEEDFIDQKTFQDYIAYSREEFHPKISQESGEELVKAYTEMRNIGRHRGRKTISATPRNLESLIRLSEALARMQHKNEVDVSHVKEAVRLQQVATHAAATDPRTGEIDMGLLAAGVSDFERQRLTNIVSRAEEILKELKQTNSLVPCSLLLLKLNQDKEEGDGEYVTRKELSDSVRRLEELQIARCDNRSADDPILKVI